MTGMASAGVGRLTLVDADEVDATNLQRQIVHRLDRIGQPKVESAAASIRARLQKNLNLLTLDASPRHPSN